MPTNKNLRSIENQYERLKYRAKNQKKLREIARYYNCRCAICGWHLPTITPKSDKQYQGGCDLHHIIAYKDGGEETPDNLILLCPNCHKLADLGIISKDELREYVKTESQTGIDWLKENYKSLYK